MNQEVILGKLADLMGWDEERARSEFAWLRLMSRMKYDGYQDFLAGMRFIESLAAWLQQFQRGEREAAYGFVRKKLVFVSAAEMQHIVELFYPDTVQPRLLRKVADSWGIPQYRVWSDRGAASFYETLLRKTLFIELSDGARIDIFRRAHAGVINNEQVVTAPRINKYKWAELLDDLRKSTGNPKEQFAFVYLVDDFIGSGTTLLRKEDGVWQGKLVRFWEDAESDGVLSTHFEPGWVVCVHHYISTYRGREIVLERDMSIRAARSQGEWFECVEFSSGMQLPANFPIKPEEVAEFAPLIQKYYDDADDSIVNRHMKMGGENARFGFGNGALPLILDHNTPNNSIALLWAETAGANGNHAMRPLFRRRQRHT